MDSSKVHTGIVLGLEDLDANDVLCDTENGWTHSDFADHILERIWGVIDRDFGTSKGATGFDCESVREKS